MVYRDTYFRIKSQYEPYHGFRNPEDAAAFHQEVARLFQSAGWQFQPRKNSSESDTAVKGKQDLYLHPMNFSGVVLEEEIPAIRAFLKDARTFQCYGVDCYAVYYDMSDEEYLKHLKSKREEIIEVILERCTTKRRNLFHTTGFAMSIAEQFTVHRISDKEGRRNLAYQYVDQLVNELIACGKLVTAKTRHGLGVRTATSKEMPASFTLYDWIKQEGEL